MANNYLNFSEEITKLKPKEKEWITKELTPPTEREEYASADKAKAKAFLDQWLKDHPLDNLADLDDPYAHEWWPDFDWKIDDTDDSLWLYTTESGCIKSVIIFVHRFLKRWRPKQVFTLTWAETCSKPRRGEFGGGWLVVSANDTRSGDTWEAAAEARRGLLK